MSTLPATTSPTVVRRLAPPDLHALLPGLVALLQACVRDGASIGWCAEPGTDTATAFWMNCAAGVAAGKRACWVVERLPAPGLPPQVLGTVQLAWDMPENGSHRVEICKLMVHPEARGQGLAGRLMDAAEAEAVAQRRSLIVLDTRTGDIAEGLYRRRGYQLGGIIPGYARSTEGVDDATSVMFKRLGPQGLQVRPVNHMAPDAVALQEALSEILLARYGNDGKAGFAHFPAAGTVFALACTADGRAVGCGALRPLDDPRDPPALRGRVGEIKRMYAVRPNAGIGPAILQFLEHEARSLGYRVLRLETRWANTRAVAFYSHQGYQVCENYGGYAGRSESACFEKNLDEAIRCQPVVSSSRLHESAGVDYLGSDPGGGMQ